MTVAMAAPRTPMPRAKMKIGSSARLAAGLVKADTAMEIPAIGQK